VPSCIDPQRQPLRIHDEGRPVTVGWIGSPTTGPYLDPVLPQLAALNDDRLQVRFVVVGADTGWRAPWIEHRPWSLARETDDIAEFDIGIMPLPDTPWARGKCGYKLLQYFAAGVPAVSSPVGVANELVGQEHGLLASTQMQWRDALTRLAKHPDERRELGLRARAFVERSYSYQSWAPRLAELLRSLAG
jgi:glycosyltransferase involved in cell wall biosynthesis